MKGVQVDVSAIPKVDALPAVITYVLWQKNPTKQVPVASALKGAFVAVVAAGRHDWTEVEGIGHWESVRILGF